MGEEIDEKFQKMTSVTLTKVVLPVPPSPTRTNLKVGMSSPVAILTLQRCSSAMEGNAAQENDDDSQSELMAFDHRQ